MTVVGDLLLERRMTEIEQARPWSPRVISKLETLIRSGDDHSLYRVNSLAFARERAMAEPEAIDLFLHAARSGLFDMSWDVLCPQSGMVLDSFGALRTLKTHYVCGLCDVSGIPTSMTSSRSPSPYRRICGACRSTTPRQSLSRIFTGGFASATMGDCPARTSAFLTFYAVSFGG